MTANLARLRWALCTKSPLFCWLSFCLCILARCGRKPQMPPSRGRVTDPSKAVIAEAKVAAVSLGMNFRYEAATNGAGEYALANLLPGTYRIEVEKSGFKKLIRPDVILHVQDALAIDFEMVVGLLSDSITVQAGAPLVNTTSATVSTVVDQTFAENIPLNGRSFQTLIMLTPGVVVTQVDLTFQRQFRFTEQLNLRFRAEFFNIFNHPNKLWRAV